MRPTLRHAFNSPYSLLTEAILKLYVPVGLSAGLTTTVF
jgi:hypothetical protein